MCGINGFNWKDEHLIKVMNKRLRHRGPDDEGVFLKNNLTLGHVRLSILDLSEKGHQPMFYSQRRGGCNEKFKKSNISHAPVGIVFNGEIYNYLELRKILKKKGYVFQTNTDTEVILASYLEWGEKCVEKFNGMWAFCIYDKKKNILFCSRDRLGQKPFYYMGGEKFIFSSELKGILAHADSKIKTRKNINKEAVQFYFALGFIPSPLTIYKNVFKLEASHNLVYDLQKKQISKYYQYYEIPDFQPQYDKKALIKEGKKLLFDAVSLRMRSDVPVGAFLSGGLDSSSVVGVMRNLTESSKLHTFSIGFEGKYDETPFINIVKDAFGTLHHHNYFREKDFHTLLDKYVEIYDEPFGDYSGFPTYSVNSMARNFVKVALSGDGGDEIFAGYTIHLVGARMNFIRKIPQPLRWLGSKLPAKKNYQSIFNLYTLKQAFKVSLQEKYNFYSHVSEEDRYKPLVFQKWSMRTLKYSLQKGNESLVEGFRIYDLLFILSNKYLVKVDRASMANSLEVRSPFLDYRFIEFAQKIPTNWKIDIFHTKKLMREIIQDIVPEEIWKRKDKQGFSPPIDKWILKSAYKKHLEKGLEVVQILDEELYRYFREKVLREENKIYNVDKIRLVIFKKWWERWIN